MNELKKLNIETHENLFSNKQSLIIFPTEQCNFRCTYCYEDFLIGRMSNETINGIKNLISKRANKLENLHVGWFGGEPLLAQDIIIEISKHIMKLNKKYSFNYTSDMTTNGYNLTPENFSILTDYKINRYQISLDGPKDVHDTTRVKANGEGTFDQIWNNLLSIRNTKKDVSITLRIHLDEEKIRVVDSLIDNIRREFINDSRFSVFIVPIGELGGKNDENLKVISEKEKNEIVLKTKQQLYGKKINEIDESPYICYASKPNNLTIRADGTIGKCTVALNDKRNNLGKINSDGSLEINQSMFNLWVKGFKNLDLDALRCPLKYL
jgi:uncharacterized protein